MESYYARSRTLIRSDAAPIMKAPRRATGSESEIARLDLRRRNQIRIQEKTRRARLIFQANKNAAREFSGQLFMGCPGSSKTLIVYRRFAFGVSTAAFYLPSCISLSCKSIEIACHAWQMWRLWIRKAECGFQKSITCV